MNTPQIEKLYDTKSCKGNGIEWTPSQEQHGAGLLTVLMGQQRNGGKRSEVRYLVVEIATAWEGRAFHLSKIDAGTDTQSDGYSVFVCRKERGHVCDCKGFAYGKGKPCKHIEAIVALLENRWI